MVAAGFNIAAQALSERRAAPASPIAVVAGSGLYANICPPVTPGAAKFREYAFSKTKTKQIVFLFNIFPF
jgi:hypothetical protein